MLKRYIEKAKTLTDRKIGIILFLLTFLLRVGYSLIIYIHQNIPGSNAYINIAREIISQGKIFYDTSHPYYDAAAPLLPWINAVTLLIFGDNYLGLYLITSLVSALVTLFTFKAASLFLKRQTAILAGLWSMLYLFYFFFTPTAGKDIWMSFFMIYLIYMLMKLFEKGEFTYSRYILFIIMFVLSFHLDERFFVFTPFVLFFILNNETKSYSHLRIKKSLIFTLLVILLMIPWTVRNFNKYGKIVLLSTRTEIFTDKLFGYRSRGNFMDKNNDIYGTFFIHDYQVDSVISGDKMVTDGGWKISSAQIEAMKRGELPHPLTGVNAFRSRIFAMLEPFQLKGRYERTGYFYYQKSLKHNIATFLFYGILFFFSFPGFYFLYKTNRKVFYLLLAPILIYTLLHALTIPYTNWRYRLPLDSIFIMAGCSGILAVSNNIKKRYFNT